GRQNRGLPSRRVTVDAGIRTPLESGDVLMAHDRDVLRVRMTGNTRKRSEGRWILVAIAALNAGVLGSRFDREIGLVALAGQRVSTDGAGISGATGEIIAPETRREEQPQKKPTPA